MHKVFLALGTNLGDRVENLLAAIHALEPEVDVIKCSPVYETPPWGYEDQPKFLNQVIEGETDLDPGELLEYLKGIEKMIGRERTFRYGPRLIDIDILFYDQLVIDSPPLVIPHAQMAERGFVLLPLADLAPEFIHPVSRRTISDLLSNVESDDIQLFSTGDCGEDK